MKCNFDSDEWYPVYSYISNEDEYPNYIHLTTELTEEELKDFIECYNKFTIWQSRLRKLSKEKKNGE